MGRMIHWKRPWCWEGLGAGGEGDERGWDGWMASPTWWTWVWVNSGSWQWTGRPGVLRLMGSQSRTWLSDWTELTDWMVVWITLVTRARSKGMVSKISKRLTQEDWCPCDCMRLVDLLPQTWWLKTTEVYSFTDLKPEVWNHGDDKTAFPPKALDKNPPLPLSFWWL